ncbi:hypothetical protein P152DRAFT_454282 [Eremomyces bilateralis CBS 781.70]|uniref:Transcription factor IIIC 90kDa subunit N-terminal domain-containing protein n=1 Tax=Eremomyces bilateralis CBS 781.70 TaxID=1392243 RepID=A0A6G1GD58_9PEZI|nr:uncharacterized protein P152DRAFT_454282 [Eremomyces bilateralis CBS 781.70]KAF1816035.1 hypothetical protein P152DRAFT_454282 [Eremomyces bilateralis CBS 781.70]
MAQLAVLNAAPGTTRCLSWSNDGELAVTAGENVQLLIPNLRSSNQPVPGVHDPLWQNLVIRTNQFRESEVPIQEPLSFQNWSIGEEISDCHALRTEWSPLGLGQYRRSVLAVLTSNQVLSIWASTGSRNNASNWKRMVVVNHALKNYFPRSPSRESFSSHERIKFELAFKRQRIRSFTWCKPAYLPLTRTYDPSTISNDTSWGENLLVLSNENLEVIVARVQAIHDIKSGEPTWITTILHHFSVASNIESTQKNLLFEDYTQNRPYVTNLTISDWSAPKQGFIEASLAFSSVEGVHIKKLRLSRNDSELHVGFGPHDIHYPVQEFGGVGPMAWWQSRSEDEIRYLVFCLRETSPNGDQVVSLCDTGDGDAPVFSRYDLHTMWNIVSGIAFSKSSDGRSYVHLPTLLDSGQCTKFPMPLLNTDNEIGTPEWQKTIAEMRTFYAEKTDLGENSCAKVWDMVSSPLGDFQATAVSLHPAKVLEYTIHAQEETMINLHKDFPSGEIPTYSPEMYSGRISSECILFTIKAWWTGGIVTKHDKTFKATIEKGLRETIENSQPCDPILGRGLSSITSDQPHHLVAALSRFSHQLCLKQFDNLLSTQAVKKKWIRTTIDKAIAKLVIREVLDLPSILSQMSVNSTRIVASYAAAQAKLQAEQDKEDSEPSTMQPSVHEFSELCDICNYRIVFEDLDWSKCARGHKFARCALTFLSIQAPGISKNCSICGLQYLAESFVIGDDSQLITEEPAGNNASNTGREDGEASKDTGGNMTDIPRKQGTLAEVIFAAFDACVYCGGKFVR